MIVDNNFDMTNLKLKIKNNINNKIIWQIFFFFICDKIYEKNIFYLTSIWKKYYVLVKPLNNKT